MGDPIVTPAMLATGAINAGAAYGFNKLGKWWYGKTKTSNMGAKKKRMYAKKRKGNFKKRKFTKKRQRPGLTKDMMVMKRELFKLRKLTNAGIATFIWKQRVPDRLVTTPNVRNTVTVSGLTQAFIDAVINNMPVYDPANPGTYQFVNFTTGTQSRKLHFVKWNSMMVIKNNYNVPVKVKVWACRCKENTSVTPLSAWSAGLADIGTGLSVNDTMVTLYDSDVFKQLWKVDRKMVRTLKAGQSMAVKYNVNPFEYDPAYGDTDTDTHLQTYGCFDWLIQIEGVLGHDTTADQQGILGAGIDYCRYTTAVVKYQGGGDFKYLEISDDASTFTNAGVVSSLTDVVKEQYNVN